VGAFPGFRAHNPHDKPEHPSLIDFGASDNPALGREEGYGRGFDGTFVASGQGSPLIRVHE